MRALPTPEDNLYNLQATSHGEAKRIWKEQIKNDWNHSCAYCGSSKNLTLDHVKPKAHGGKDDARNVICACRACNHSKGNTPIEKWYQSQSFFSEDKYETICKWTSYVPVTHQRTATYKYRPRLNICYGT